MAGVGLWVWLPATAAFVAVSIAPMVRSPIWWIRCWDFPRAQLAVVGLGLLALGPPVWPAAGAAGHWLSALTAGLTGLHIWRVLPFTPLWPAHVAERPVEDPARAVSILIANVLQENREPDRLSEMIRRRDPDIVFMVETDGFWADAMAPALADYPRRVVQAQDNHYGLIFATRLEVDHVEVTHRADPKEPILLADLLLRSGEALRFWGLHPEPPIPGRSTRDRDADLVVLGREIREHGGTTVVAGDLNDVAWSHTTRLFLRLSGLLDPRRGRGLKASFHADWRLARWPLDHVFHTPDLAIAEHAVERHIGSDHFPVWTVLHRTDGARVANAAPERPAPGDADEADRLARYGLRPAGPGG